MYQLALDVGDVAMIKYIFDRIDGKLVEKHEELRKTYKIKKLPRIIE